MLYKDFLTSTTRCPFCEGERQEILLKNDLAFLTYALAPYHKHHLLVVPKAHMGAYGELQTKDHAAIQSLLDTGMQMLRRLGYSNMTILVRDGKESGKSVEHLHYHLIPDIRLGDVDHLGEERRVLNQEEIVPLLQELRRALSF